MPGQGAVGPVLVCAAYYLGAQIGFALQSPNAPQSVLWLPNSILLAVLLIVPFRRWPVYLAAAFPAQMLVSVGTGAPPLVLALLFLTNCADASLGAFLVRRIARSERPFVFDGLATTMVFVAFGATLPTVLLSFADAGISVATGWSDSYYDAFVTRARSNVLTHLIVVPAIVDLAARDWRRIRGAALSKEPRWPGYCSSPAASPSRDRRDPRPSSPCCICRCCCSCGRRSGLDRQESAGPR